MKFFKHAFILLLVFISSCKLIDYEEGSRRAINRKSRKLAALCYQFPTFCKTDTIKGEVTINNPVKPQEINVPVFIDTGRINNITTLIFEKCKDKNLSNKVKTILETTKCIKDSIIIEDTLFKAKITQDSIGSIKVSIFPKEVELKAKYKVVCPPQGIVTDKYYSHTEWWFLLSILIMTVVGIFVHLKIVENSLKSKK